jgi:dipeptidyl aminopeptidase/acylaminoacyl peptidase
MSVMCAAGAACGRRGVRLVMLWAALAGAFGLAAAAERPALAQPATAEAAAGADVAAEGSAGGAERRAPEPLTLERIMADPDWIGRSPERAYWSDDGERIYFRQKREGSRLRDLFVLDVDDPAARPEPERVPDAELRAVDQPGGSFDRGLERKVYAAGGDLFLKELRTGAVTQLTRTRERESGPVFERASSEDGRASAVLFFRGGEVFRRDLESGLEAQLTDLRTDDEPTHEPDEAFLAQEQLGLFEYLRDERRHEAEARERREALDDADPSRGPRPTYLDDGLEIVDRAVSPGGRWLALELAPPRARGERDAMPVFITEDSYVGVERVRPKVGIERRRASSLVLVDMHANEVIDVDLSELPGIREDPLRELREVAAEADRQDDDDTQDGDKAIAEAAATADGADGEMPSDEDDGKQDEAAEAEGEPRDVTIWRLAWSDDGGLLAIMARSNDNKDRWIAVVDVADAGSVGEQDAGEETDGARGEDAADDGADSDAEQSDERRSISPTVVERKHDPAWIGRQNQMAWTPFSRTLAFLSERSGYGHLYLWSPGDDEPQAVTRGEFVVTSFDTTRDGSAIFLRANAQHPGDYDIHRYQLPDGPLEQITTLGGLTSATPSPDGSRLLIEHSEATRPEELYVQEARPGAEPRRLTFTVSDAFLAYDWPEPAYVEIPSRHGRPIHARLYLPDSLEPRAPAVLFVHGAGYLQNAHKGWSNYFREYMFHALLQERGVVVLDMDFRASAGYGRDWRTAIYRHMGKPETEDLADGVAWLAREHGVDDERVGVYGGSYGGFLTLYAMFTEPQLFACGAALRSVTDWAHYNDFYTANILNTPDIDPEAYRRSSPIYFAEGLENPLLMCHGMVDANVLAKDTVRLAQRLIELEKKDWEMALYPVEPHGFRTPAGWLDEYRRILKLFERHLGVPTAEAVGAR